MWVWGTSDLCGTQSTVRSDEASSLRCLLIHKALSRGEAGKEGCGKPWVPCGRQAAGPGEAVQGTCVSVLLAQFHADRETGWRGEVGPGEVERERWAQVRWRRAGRPVGVSIAKNLLGRDWFGLETTRCLFLVKSLFLLFVFLLFVVLVLVFIHHLLLSRATSRARVGVCV